MDYYYLILSIFYLKILATINAQQPAPASTTPRAGGYIVKEIECTFLWNYDTKHDSSTACIFANIWGNSSIYFTFSPSYKGYPIDFESFEIIEFHNSTLHRMPQKILEFFSSTEVLDVSECQMGSICGLQGGTKLKELRASKNKIKNLAENIFTQNRRLTFLDLSHNLISYLRANTFTKTPNLSHLDLSYNKFEEYSNAFQHLHQLKYFDLSSNNLERIPVLNGLKKLETLKLNDNFIESINPDAFMKMASLQTLEVKGNFLHTLYLEFNSSMIYVDISHNALHDLEVISDIATLDASTNKLRIISINPNTQVFSLNLSNNLFKDTDGIRSIKSLRHLNLAMNHLSYLTSRTFWNLDNLVELNLSKNFLKQVNLYHFNQLNNLKYLWLSNNEISRMKLTFKSFDNILPALEEIGIDGNPWNCKYLVHMVNSFSEKGVRLVNKLNEVLNDFEENVLGIPCHTENKLQQCRNEMESLKVAYETEIERLNDLIEEMKLNSSTDYSFDNETIES